MILSVVIPSYRRSLDLARCLGALSAQDRLADQVLVVVRTADEDTLRVAAAWQERLPLKIIEVTAPGQVHALNAGLARCTGEVVAITDDDAAPRPDWLVRIEAYFEADKRIGGVGGRDWVHHNGMIEAGAERIVGKVRWFGRFAGNHHLGVGPAREVDSLKGANLAFRISAIRPIGFDTRLRGSGAQANNDMIASLAVKRAGWRLIYDPEVAVDHYPAPRFDRDGRGNFDPLAAADRAYNYRLALQQISPAWRRWAAILWFHIVGTSDEPGVLRPLARRVVSVAVDS
jgi:cellulose synthase/poly-beta-1,6-N-acetylglucosamine synthase-like glycosyltransferase